MSGYRGIRRLQLGKLTITPPVVAKQKPEGAVIMLHGSCDTGSGMKAWLDKIRESEFNFHNYRILYPSAPTRPYTLMNGEKVGIWFDRLSLGPRVPEDLRTIEATAHELSELIQQESKTTGIPLDKMVLGGFSMGGIMALHLGYRFQTQMAGVFALSSFLPVESEVYNTLKEKSEKPRLKKPNEKQKFQERLKQSGLVSNSVEQNNNKIDKGTPTPTLDKILKNITLDEGVKPPQYPKLFMSNSFKDPLTLYPWAKSTFGTLRTNCGNNRTIYLAKSTEFSSKMQLTMQHGIEGHFYTHQAGGHSIERNQLTLLHGWIQQVLQTNPGTPPKSNKKSKKNKEPNINDEACEPVERW